MKNLSHSTEKHGQPYSRQIAVVALGALLIVSLMLGMAACQPESDGPEAAVEVSAQEAAEPATADSPVAESELAEEKPESETQAVQPPPDPDALWVLSSHADTFVMGDDGTNIKCARCHAPVQWVPTMDDIPESCLTCKFEVEPPPPVVAEAEWGHVPCQVCHKVKKDEVKPEVLWLEIAQIEEYAELTSTTELCLKCHDVGDAPGHEQIQFTAVHQDLACTECHDAHSNSSGCDKPGCHDDVFGQETASAGHDQDHAQVACMACHDAAGLEVGLDQESGEWTTFVTVEGEESPKPFVSHEVQLEGACDRCHFAGNIWGLSESVAKGS